MIVSSVKDVGTMFAARRVERYPRKEHHPIGVPVDIATS